jgi:tetratricopeptide (TPR) repeat protein
MPSTYYRPQGKVGILLSRSHVLFHIGEADRALQDAGRALDMAKQFQLLKDQAQCLMMLANAHDQLNQMEAMRQEALAALDLYRRLGDRFGEGQATGQLGIAVDSLEGSLAARPYYERALTIARTQDDRHNLCGCLLEMGWILIRTKEYESAKCHLEEGLEMARAEGDLSKESFGTSCLGEIALHQGRPEEALARHQQALAIRERIGNKWFQAITWSWLSGDWRALGDLAKARMARENALAISRTIGIGPETAFHLGLLAELCEVVGKLESALGYCREALDFCRQHDLKEDIPLLTSRLSSVQFSMGNWEAAESAVKEALSLDLSRSDKALAALVLARLTLVRGDRILAFGRLQEAREWAEGADKPELAFQALSVWAEIHLSLGDASAVRKALEAMHARLPSLREKDAESLLEGLAACLLACEGKKEEAGTALAKALERMQAMGLRVEEARSQLRFGKALGVEKGKPYFEKARGLFSELGAQGWAELCAQALKP